MFDKLEDLLVRYEEIMSELSEPDVANDANRFRKLMKEQSDLTPIVEAYREYKKNKQAIEDAKMDGTVLLQFEEALGYKITEELMPATYHLLMRAMECFGTYGCNEAKQYYRRTRPFVYYNERSLVPKDEKWMKKSYSYPSGHSANFYGLGCILMALNPDRQNEIYNRAKEGAYSRVIVGAHWFSDTEASKIVAMTVFARLQSDPEFIADFQAAKEEIERITNKCK